MTTEYEMKRASDGYLFKANLTETEWFEIFLSGRYNGAPLEYIEKVGNPAKHVGFEENLNGAQSQ